MPESASEHEPRRLRAFRWVVPLAVVGACGGSTLSGSDAGPRAGSAGLAGHSGSASGAHSGGRGGGAGGEAPGGSPAAAGESQAAGAGGVAGAGATSAAGGASGAEANPLCPSPSAWSRNLEACDQGFVHRPRALACPFPTRDEDIPGVPSDAGLDPQPDPNECTRDEDCGGHGYCLYAENDDGYGDSVNAHVCVQACETDDDCASDELCACEHREQNATHRSIEVGVCRQANCRTDADCDTLCVSPLNPVPVATFPGIPTPYRQLDAFRCLSPQDECAARSQCAPAPEPRDCGEYPVCVSDGDAFRCEYRVSYFDC